MKYVIVKDISLIDIATNKGKPINFVRFWNGGNFGKFEFKPALQEIMTTCVEKSWKDFVVELDDERVKQVKEKYKNYNIIPYEDFEREIEEILLLQDII